MPSPWQLERLEEEESGVLGGGLPGGPSGTITKSPQSSSQGKKNAPQAVTLALVEVVATEKKKQKKKTKPQSSHGTEVKATAGDCDVEESWNGRIVINTIDNTYKIFVEGVWRTIIVW